MIKSIHIYFNQLFDTSHSLLPQRESILTAGRYYTLLLHSAEQPQLLCLSDTP